MNFDEFTTTISNIGKLDKIEDELIDRFGDYPAAVENLLAVAGLKVDADLAQVLNVLKKDNNTISHNIRHNSNHSHNHNMHK